MPWHILQGRQEAAALVNWNKQHWTVLQPDPSGEGWMHTNSIEGARPKCGRKRRLRDNEVDGILRDIRREAGDCALHVIAPCASDGHRYLEVEGFRAMAGTVSDETQGDIVSIAGVEADALSMVTLNVDGLGE